jgi:DNA (cytosine-5)-methyltransferase 1
MTFPLEGYDAIHASPPCQGYSTMTNRHASSAATLIGELRPLLAVTGRPYVIENVAGARREFRDSIRLTGEMFGLRTHRARLFECSFLIGAPPQPPRQQNPIAVYGRLDGRRLWTRADGSEHRAPREIGPAAAAMGIDWMEWDELREAIPPAYTEWIGRQLLQQLRAAA